MEESVRQVLKQAQAEELRKLMDEAIDKGLTQKIADMITEKAHVVCAMTIPASEFNSRDTSLLFDAGFEVHALNTDGMIVFPNIVEKYGYIQVSWRSIQEELLRQIVKKKEVKSNEHI